MSLWFIIIDDFTYYILLNQKILISHSENGVG